MQNLQKGQENTLTPRKNNNSKTGASHSRQGTQGEDTLPEEQTELPSPAHHPQQPPSRPTNFHNITERTHQPHQHPQPAKHKKEEKS